MYNLEFPLKAVEHCQADSAVQPMKGTDLEGKTLSTEPFPSTHRISNAYKCAQDSAEKVECQ